CAWAQVCHQAAKLRYMSGGQADIPITFRTVYGAMGQAAAQHSETVYAQFMSVPGLKIVTPSGPYDMKGLLKSAIRDNNPVLVFEHMGLGRSREAVPEEEDLVPIGKGAVKREGKDVTAVADGVIRGESRGAAQTLEEEGAEGARVDPRTVVPRDEEITLHPVNEIRKVRSVDEGHLRGGTAAEIAGVISDKGFHSLDARV